MGIVLENVPTNNMHLRAPARVRIIINQPFLLVSGPLMSRVADGVRVLVVRNSVEMERKKEQKNVTMETVQITTSVQTAVRQMFVEIIM